MLVCMRVEGMGCLCVYVKERGGCVKGCESSGDSGTACEEACALAILRHPPDPARVGGGPSRPHE